MSVSQKKLWVVNDSKDSDSDRYILKQLNLVKTEFLRNRKRATQRLVRKNSVIVTDSPTPRLKETDQPVDYLLDIKFDREGEVTGTKKTRK